MTSRANEIATHIESLGLCPSDALVAKLERELNKRCKTPYGCLSPGASTVRDWIRIQLSEMLYQLCEKDRQDTSHVVGCFHFWAWDVEKYGPAPKHVDPQPVDTMRSPSWRLVDATPVDRTARKVFDVDDRRKAKP